MMTKNNETNKWENLEFNAELGRRYHIKRSDFFYTLHHINLASNLVFGGIAFATILLEKDVICTLIVIGLLSVCNILSLVFKWAEKAEKHKSLYRRYVIQLSNIKGKKFEQDVLSEHQSLIEMEEPNLMGGLLCIAHIEATTALDLKDGRELAEKLPTWVRIWANIFDMPQTGVKYSLPSE